MTTMVTVPETLTARTVLTRIQEITQICATLIWKEVKSRLETQQKDWLLSLATTVTVRVQSIVMDWHGPMMLMILLLGTRVTTSSLWQCMTTCINVDTSRMFLVRPCVDASSKCPPSLALTVPRLTPPRGSGSLTIALPMRLMEASLSLISTSMRAKESITVTTISGLTWAVSSTKARSATVSGVRPVASSPTTTTVRLPSVRNMM
mmetsp:Transcript_15502/g.22047  ORF Transcript_15502/g.22047 Transcript_15502/m.22047 type:complete len:206 (+) Transcript_15502:753-1370(+)